MNTSVLNSRYLASHWQAALSWWALAAEGARIAGYDLAKQIAYPGYQLGTSDDLTSLAQEIQAKGSEALVFAGDVREVAGKTMNWKLTVYQKPTCTKCRTTLRLLKERGAEFEAINYYEIPFTAPHLRGLLKKLALSAREILRKDEPVAKQLGIAKKDFSDEELIALMVKHLI